MAEIKIEFNKSSAGWNFQVSIAEGATTSRHQVTLQESDYKRLSAQNENSPEELVRRSFEFLLRREPKESILSQFDLMVIGRYFPQYESEISA